VTTDFNLLRRRLETERKRLMQELEGLKTNVCPAGERQVSSPWAKEDEHATEIAEVERRGALEKRLGDRLAEVEHALYKFDQGTYDLCDNCGQLIDPARLEALPQANLCLNCKAHEGGRKRQGDSGRKNSAYEESKAIPPIQ
jgi:RNA polymerase-binding transcription factor DksA